MRQQLNWWWFDKNKIDIKKLNLSFLLFFVELTPIFFYSGWGNPPLIYQDSCLLVSWFLFWPWLVDVACSSLSFYFLFLLNWFLFLSCPFSFNSYNFKIDPLICHLRNYRLSNCFGVIYIKNPKLLLNDEYINCCQTFERFSKRKHGVWLLSPYILIILIQIVLVSCGILGLYIFPQDTNLYYLCFKI